MSNGSRLWDWYKGQLPPDGSSPLALLMIQPTRFCNIDCRYCYLPHRNATGTFDLHLLRPLFEKLSSCGLLGRQVSVLWHAGEPLVVPIDYYEKAFEMTREIVAGRSNVSHVIQTNAILLTQAHCELIKKYRVRIGVSIDGPEFIHDRNRVTRSGKGTFTKTMAGVNLLRKNRIPFDIICVLTSFSLDYANELYDFFRELRPMELGFNFDEIEGTHTASSFSEPGTEEKYRAFFTTLLRRVTEDRGRTRIRELMGAFAVVNSTIFNTASVSTESNPFGILSVDVDGNLATFSPELLDLADGKERFTFGSIAEVDFVRSFSNPAFSRVHSAIQAGVEMCKASCGYFDFCGGGSPSNKLGENGRFDSTETTYCRFKKQILIDVTQDFIIQSLLRDKQRMHRPSGLRQSD
jgi:uncharacterized protein